MKVRLKPDATYDGNASRELGAYVGSGFSRTYDITPGTACWRVEAST
jgi:hypothetical protein